ncbi:MAG: hypothetical protein ACKV22_10350 [Bryobacteraceae bacterium]
MALHTRRVVSWILGAWLAGCVFMFWVATQNFRSVDRLLATPAPEAAALLAKAGRHDMRLLLRYHSSELNRLYFSGWEWAQLLLGAAAAAASAGFKSSRSMGGVVLFLVALTAAEHWLLTPDIVSLGRAIDFVAGPTPERERFWKLHGAYSGIEVLKMIALAVLTLRLWIPSRRQKEAPDA